MLAVFGTVAALWLVAFVGVMLSSAKPAKIAELVLADPTPVTVAAGLDRGFYVAG